MSRKDDVLAQIFDLLGQEGMRARLCPDRGVIEFGFRGDAASLPVLIGVGDELLTVLIMVRHTVVVPECRRTEVAELICRANYGLRLGRFELDMSDGELNFVVAIPLVDAALGEKQFRYALEAALLYSDRYYNAFHRLLFDSDLSPAEAVAEVEMSGSRS